MGRLILIAIALVFSIAYSPGILFSQPEPTGPGGAPSGPIIVSPQHVPSEKIGKKMEAKKEKTEGKAKAKGKAKEEEKK